MDRSRIRWSPRAPEYPTSKTRPCANCVCRPRLYSCVIGGRKPGSNAVIELGGAGGGKYGTNAGRVGTLSENGTCPVAAALSVAMGKRRTENGGAVSSWMNGCPVYRER